MSAGHNSGDFKQRHRRKRSKQSGQKELVETPTSMDHSLAIGQSIAAPSTKRGKFEIVASNNKTANHSNNIPSQSSSKQQDAAAADAGGKRRRRRAPRRRWKPYYKLTNDERRQLEIREERRAERVRALRFKHGLPVAPYNTTQFLLNDRQQRGNLDEPNDVDEIVANIAVSSGNKRKQQQQQEHSDSMDESVSAESGRENSSATPSDDHYDDMLEREFDNEYESAYAERLESMTKNDLIKEYLELEKLLEKSQRELNARKIEVNDLRQRLSAYEEQSTADRPIVGVGDEVKRETDDVLVSSAAAVP